MQGDEPGFILAERCAQLLADTRERLTAQSVLSGIKIANFPKQVVGILDALLQPLNGKADVVGQRDINFFTERRPSRSAACSMISVHTAKCSSGISPISSASLLLLSASESA